MTIRCKHGDIAIIINETPQCIGNIGHLVHVRGPYGSIDVLQKYGWFIKPVGGQKLWVQLHSAFDTPVLEKIYWNNPRCLPDEWLLPLRRPLDFFPEESEERELRAENPKEPATSKGLIRQIEDRGRVNSQQLYANNVGARRLHSLNSLQNLESAQQILNCDTQSAS